MLVYRQSPAEHGLRQSQPSSAEGGELITFTSGTCLSSTFLSTHLVAGCSDTFAVRSSFFGIGFVAKRSVFDELRIGKLRQIGHNRLVINMRVGNFFRRDDLIDRYLKKGTADNKNHAKTNTR